MQVLMYFCVFIKAKIDNIHFLPGNDESVTDTVQLNQCKISNHSHTPLRADVPLRVNIHYIAIGNKSRNDPEYATCQKP